MFVFPLNKVAVGAVGIVTVAFPLTLPEQPEDTIETKVYVRFAVGLTVKKNGLEVTPFTGMVLTPSLY
jgi:hypothetical protein